MISKEMALDALRSIRHGLWEIDIPHPSCPEYVEHHKQVQRIIGITDEWISRVLNVPEEEDSKDE